MPVKTYIPVLALALVCGCAKDTIGSPPPKDGFYFPVSVAAVESVPGQPVLYVVSSNFDLRYNRGSVIAVDLAKLTRLDGPVTAGVDLDRGYALIDAFAGEVAYYAAAPRLFVPTRYAGRLYALQIDEPGKLSCLPAAESPGQDCLEQGIELEDPNNEAVRAADPFGVAIDGQTVFITHVDQADNPPDSFKDPASYLTSVDALSLGPPSFLPIGLAPTQGIAVTPAGLYLAGRALVVDELGSSLALRRVLADRPCATNAECGMEGGVCMGGQCRRSLDAGLTSSTRIEEARSVVLSSDATRLFISTRSPDGLLTLDIAPDAAGAPRNRFLGFVTLPAGPNQMLVVPRPGQRDLVAVSCTNGNAVALYDDELGEVTGVVEGIEEPFGLARASLPGAPAGTRLFVASFGNHTVDVVDIPDINRPRAASVVGRLGYGAHRPLGIDLPEAR